jgi:hypothetical protein
VAGARDPLVSVERVHHLSVLPQVQVVKVPGAHALNYSSPELIAALIEAHVAGETLPPAEWTGVAEMLEVRRAPSPSPAGTPPR